MGLNEALAFLLLAVGTILSVMAGRGLATRSHDIRLAKEKALRMSPAALIYYLYGLFALIANFLFLSLSKIVGFGFEALWRASIMPALIDVLYSTAIILASYYFFRHRFRKSKNYITIEGRLAAKILKRLSLTSDGNGECVKGKCRKDDGGN